MKMMVPEESTTQISSGNRGMKVIRAICFTAFAGLAGTVGFLVYERVVGVTNCPHTNHECWQSSGSLQSLSDRFATEEETIENVKTSILKIKITQNEMNEVISDYQQLSSYKYDMVMENLEQMTKDISEIKSYQSKMKEEITELLQNMETANSEYRRLNVDAIELREILNETKDNFGAIHNELRIETADNIDAVNTSHRKLQLSFDALKQNIDELKPSGATYVRWGRKTCPGNGSELLYLGYTGGSRYDHTGAAVSLLCLPMDPDWVQHTNKEDRLSGFVYGTEYELSNDRTDNLFEIGHVNQEVPCAVCNIQIRSSTIMVPGKTTCHPGWTLEYTGYLMSGWFNHTAATDYNCIDKDPENVEEGNIATNEDGRLLYFVEARCGSLKCPPYVNGMELACVVCSK